MSIINVVVNVMTTLSNGTRVPSWGKVVKNDDAFAAAIAAKVSDPNVIKVVVNRARPSEGKADRWIDVECLYMGSRIDDNWVVGKSYLNNTPIPAPAPAHAPLPKYVVVGYSENLGASIYHCTKTGVAKDGVRYTSGKYYIGGKEVANKHLVEFHRRLANGEFVKGNAVVPTPVSRIIRRHEDVPAEVIEEATAPMPVVQPVVEEEVHYCAHHNPRFGYRCRNHVAVVGEMCPEHAPKSIWEAVKQVVGLA